MLAFIGDVHLDLDELEDIVRGVAPGTTQVIQVGDLHLKPNPRAAKTRWRPMKLPLGFIDGNDHYFPETRGLQEPTEVRPGLTFYPRGTVLELDSRRIGFLGGGETIYGQESLIPGTDWWPKEEGIAERDVTRLLRNANGGGIDLLVTHTPPASITEAVLGSAPHPSSVRVEEAWQALGYPELICGHLHEHYASRRVQVLPAFGLTYR
ncbi:hypothetical protein BH11GEM2_BH11GEM2_30610 [soil metagenome]